MHELKSRREKPCVATNWNKKLETPRDNASSNAARTQNFLQFKSTQLSDRFKELKSRSLYTRTFNHEP
jgi:hypothetical protein